MLYPSCNSVTYNGQFFVLERDELTYIRLNPRNERQLKLPSPYVNVSMLNRILVMNKFLSFVRNSTDTHIHIPFKASRMKANCPDVEDIKKSN